MSVHPVDRAAGAIYMLKGKRLRLFPEGWGEDLSLFDRSPGGEPETIEVSWSAPGSRGDGHRLGHFESPLGGLLADGIRRVPFEMTEPPQGADRLVVLLPSWNDHGFTTRRKLAAELARLGIASVAFDIPLYGQRRRTPEPEQAIRTVADFGLMGYGAIEEARSLLAHFRSRFTVGVAGYSMGGNLAALASNVPFPVATTPLAASHSPGPVYLDGILRAGIDWDALGGRRQAGRLREVLGSVSAIDHPPLPHHARAVIVGAARDGFVPRQTTIDLAAHWPGAELRWVDAGHATLLWRHRPLLARAISDSFERLKS